MMTNASRWLGGSVGVALVAIGMMLTTACDPPKDLTPSASADASSPTAGTEASSPFNAAKVGIPVSGDVVLIGGWSSGNKSTATAEFFDPATKKFKSTGSMATSAGALSADLLNSGGILVAGGFGGKSKFTKRTVSNAVTGAAITNLQTYDPTTGLFTAATAPLLTARMGATATTLASDKVLIAGGIDATGAPLDTAELFDPVAGTTAATVNTMGSARAFHTATLVGGKVLIVGGATDATADLTATADLYDPATNSFAPTVGAMGTARGAHAAVILTTGPDSGKVLIVGGITNSGGLLSAIFSAELFDPVATTFSPAANVMNDARAFPTATVLSSGDVLIVGGFTNFFSAQVNGATGSLNSLFGSTLKSAELYDPIATTFTCVPGSGFGGSLCLASMKVARAAHTATLFTGGPLAGQVLLAGGIGATKPNSTSSELSEAELYDPSTNQFKKTGSLKKKRGLHVAILLQ
jgi:hypothetical protein